MVSTYEDHVAGRVEEGTQCRHHWLIDVAGGPTSKGVCRLCGAERQFRNYLEGTDWERELTPQQPVHYPLPSGDRTEEPEEGE